MTKERLNRIQTNKDEARLLVKATKNNLDILELCEDLQKNDGENKYKDLAKSLEKTHIEISRNYNEVAREKLISVPYQTNIVYNGNQDEMLVGSATKLDRILSKINIQLKLLDSLSKISDNTEFKVLVIRDSFKLNSSKKRIVTLLKEMEKPSLAETQEI